MKFNFEKPQNVTEKVKGNFSQFEGFGESIAQLGDTLKDLPQEAWDQIKRIPKIALIIPMILTVMALETSAQNPGGAGGGTGVKAQTEQVNKTQKTPQEQAQTRQNVKNGLRTAFRIGTMITQQTPNRVDDRIAGTLERVNTQISGTYINTNVRK